MGPDGRVGSRVGPGRLHLDRRSAGPQPPDRLLALRRPREARGPRNIELLPVVNDVRAGRGPIARASSPTPQPRHLRALPRRPGRALRLERHVLGRAPGAAQAPGARLAGLERAPPAAVLGRPGKEQVGPSGWLRPPAACGLQGRQGQGPPRPRGARGPHPARLGGTRRHVRARRHQALLRRGGAADLPADGEAIGAGHQAVSPNAPAPWRQRQADLSDRDLLAGLEGQDAPDQVPGPRNPAHHGDQARSCLRRAGQEQASARARSGLLVHLGLPYGRGGSVFNYSGLQAYRNGEWTAQPALGAFQRKARQLEGCQKNAQGACR